MIYCLNYRTWENDDAEIIFPLKDMNTKHFVALLSNYRNLDLLITYERESCAVGWATNIKPREEKTPKVFFLHLAWEADNSVGNEEEMKIRNIILRSPS